MKRESNRPDDEKMVNWLKADMVDNLGALLKSLLETGNDATVDALANLIIDSYVIGRRAGVNFQVIDMRIKHRINSSINDLSDLDQVYGDLLQLQSYLEGKEQKKR